MVVTLNKETIYTIIRDIYGGERLLKQNSLPLAIWHLEVYCT